MSAQGLGVSYNFSGSGAEQGITEGSFIDKTKSLTPYVEMVNGCPYIIFLEYGWSGQSPFGMVRISMREMRGGELPQQMATSIREEWNKFFWSGTQRGMVT